MAAIIDEVKCTACGVCEDACPQEATTVGDVARLRHGPAEWPGGSDGTSRRPVPAYCRERSGHVHGSNGSIAAQAIRSGLADIREGRRIPSWIFAAGAMPAAL